MPERKIPILGKLQTIPEEELNDYVFLSEHIAIPTKEIEPLIKEINGKLAEYKKTGVKPSRITVFAMNILSANELINVWAYKPDA